MVLNNIIWFPLLLLCESTQSAIALRVTWRSGSELAKALADPSISVADLEGDVVLQNSDFAGYKLPILVERDFVIQGSFNQQPFLDFNYAAKKVQLGNGVTLTLRNLTLRHTRAKSMVLSPGIDLLTPTPPGAPATVILEGGTHISELCFAQNSQGYAARPAEIPGQQRVTRNMSQPGCVNSTTAPFLERCWETKGRWDDLALVAYDLTNDSMAADAFEHVADPLKMFMEMQRFTNYNMWFLYQLFVCAAVVSDECVQSLGILGCIWQEAAKLPQPRPVVPHLDDSSPAPSIGGGAEPSSGLRGGGSGVLPVVVGTVVGAVVVGALVVVALLLVARRRRRRRQHPQKETSKKGYGSFTGGSAAETGRSGRTEVAKGVVPDRDDELGTGFNGTGSGRTVNFSTPSDGLALQHVVLTPLTPPREDIELNARLQAATAGGSNGGCGDVGADGDLLSDGEFAGNAPQPPSTLVSNCPSPQEVKLLDVVLGRGGSGKVVVGEYSGRRVAVKILYTLAVPENKPLLASLPYQAIADTGSTTDAVEAWAGVRPSDQEQERSRAEMLRQAFCQEVEVLGRCQHPNVVRLLAVCAAPPRMCLVMELSETNLTGLLYGARFLGLRDASSPEQLLPMLLVLNIAIDIARGLEYLHPTVMHRDLKPANVLIDGVDTPRPVAKIADFGLARLRCTVQATANPEVGTPPYMAPECFDPFNHVVTHQVDMYSWAVLVYEMLSGKLPWDGASISEIAFNVALKGRRPPLHNVPKERLPVKLERLIAQCWDQVPDRRPAAAEVVKHLLLIQQGYQDA